jgi:N-methylhydantoinase B/oxoprolinase/acetone carboxylase alpha subunit
MKTKKTLTDEQIEKLIKDGKEMLLARKNEVIEAAEKKYNKKVKSLEDKYKVVEAKVKKAKSEKVKDAVEVKKRISKKEIAALIEEGKSPEEIAKHFETEIIKAKQKSPGLTDKKRKK